MVKADVLLLHPPSVYDFRRKHLHFGPISDGVPPTPVFEMYPLGFVSLLSHLLRRGFKARIFNLALKMLNDPGFDVEAFIAKLDVKLVGIDLHWLVHSHGSLEVAKLIKKYQPDTKVVLGGLSATYYFREIMENYPCVDYLIRGDSAEKPLVMLAEKIERGSCLEGVPNLVWRDGGKIRVNPFSYVPENLDDYDLDYRYVAKSAMLSLDVDGHKPFQSWNDYTCTAVFIVKGCLFNCAVCGGSRCAYERFYNRSKPAFKDPKQVAEEVKVISDYIKGPIYLLGEPRQRGASYAQELLKEITREKISNPLVVELFYPAQREYLTLLSKASPVFSLQISPETHDEELRLLYGRTYRNDALEKSITEAVKLGAEAIDTFFTVGIPKQSRSSVADTLEYIDHLLSRFGTKLNPFVLPVAPYVDPGSPAFENPAPYGYKILYRSLSEHRSSLNYPCWLCWLNYESAYLPREELARSLYSAGVGLNLIRLKHGAIGEEEAELRIRRIREAELLVGELYKAASLSEGDLRKVQIKLDELSSQLRDGELFSKRDFRLKTKVGIRKLAPVKLIFNELRSSLGHKHP